jgi:hypothetical protein
MELEASLPCSQEPATGPVPNQMNPTAILQPYFLKSHFNIIQIIVQHTCYAKVKLKKFNITVYSQLYLSTNVS